MAGWDHASVVAAAASLTADAERCPGCGLAEDDAWHVTAELTICPTCEARERALAPLADQKQTAGYRSVFRTLHTLEERMTESAAVKFTRKGAEMAHRWRTTRRAEPGAVESGSDGR